jgi:hypothetical protein
VRTPVRPDVGTPGYDPAGSQLDVVVGGRAVGVDVNAGGEGVGVTVGDGPGETDSERAGVLGGEVEEGVTVSEGVGESNGEGEGVAVGDGDGDGEVDGVVGTVVGNGVVTGGRCGLNVVGGGDTIDAACATATAVASAAGAAGAGLGGISRPPLPLMPGGTGPEADGTGTTPVRYACAHCSTTST